MFGGERTDLEGISADDKGRYENALRRESQGGMKLRQIKEIETYDADTMAADGTVIKDTTNRTAGQFMDAGDIPVFISPSGSLCLNEDETEPEIMNVMYAMEDARVNASATAITRDTPETDMPANVRNIMRVMPRETFNSLVANQKTDT